MSNPDPIVAELVELRRRAGVTQDRLAGRIGCSRRALSCWENGRATPGVDDAEAYAQALGHRLALVKRDA